ncbi:MAG: glycosyltransferase [Bacteroidia bacterium]|nr:glycosyltransferase [Bacteroidia bacterium]
MNIIHFANHFSPRIGGVELSVACTAEAQARRGHRVTVLTETPSSEDPARPYQVKRFSVPIRRPFTRLLYWRWMWQNRAWIGAADVLHFHDYTTFLHWFSPLRLLIRKPRYVITFHGFEGMPIRRRHKVFRSVTARCMHVCLGVGSYLAQYYAHRFDAFYLGAPVRALGVLPRGDAATFAYVGRLAPDTGIVEFLRDLETVVSGRSLHATVRLAGEGSAGETLRARTSAYLRMEFRGMVTDPEAVYTGAGMIVATGFLALFDAFRTGIPVIIPAYNTLKLRYARSIPGIEDMAFVLPDSESAVATLRNLLDGSAEELARARAARASEWIRGRSWDEVAEVLDVWYQSSHTNERETEVQAGRSGVCA